MRARLLAAVAALLLAAAAGAAGKEPRPAGPAADERSAFLAALAALRRGERARFERLRDALAGYPLHPYLVFTDLGRRIRQAPEAELERFIDTWRDSPLGERLRARWLTVLARQGRWRRFLEHYRDGLGTRLRCQHARALIETGERARGFAEVEALWRVGRSQPSECDRPFAAWRAAGRLTAELAWERAALAMRAGKPRLARYLRRFLPPAERALLGVWLELRREPRRAARLLAAPGPPARREAALIDVVRRLAWRDARRAVALWEELAPRARWQPATVREVRRALAVGLARRGAAEALSWFDRLAAEDLDERTRAWAVVLAARLGRWSRVLAEIEALGEESAARPRWRYWQARALEALGRAREARARYAALATERSYYGFLAADRIGAAYAIRSRPLAVDQTLLAELEHHPGLARARELRALGWYVDARREWRFATTAMSREQRLAAAALAHRWGWHGRTILTLAGARAFDDLEMRFPLAHRTLVERAARRQRLDPAWLFAVIRQESAFIADARSPKGALGLMQIMPRTGRHIARRIGERPPARAALLEPATSIRLGSAHLRELLDRVAGSALLASASYNAGLARVRGWLPERGSLAADLWVESIPFGETREYVRRVLAYTAVYQHRLGRRPERLSARMAPISAAAAGAWLAAATGAQPSRASSSSR